jgi:hypothetical protein
MDHDQRFKTLIQEFFVDFLDLFFRDWAVRLDLRTVQWLDKELYPDPPEGTRHKLDLLAKVPVVPAFDPQVPESLLLVHIEIEAPDRVTALTPRLPYYYHFLRDKLQLPVLPIVLYLKVGLDGVGVDRYVEELWGLEVNCFQYLYVGLPGLDGIEYVQGDNWLGVALSALMKIPSDRVAWLGAEALRRLAEAPLNEQQRFLLGECVQAYLPLDEQQLQQFENLLQSESYAGVRAMNQTMYEKGRQEGQRQLICGLIEDRFGPISEATRKSLERLSLEHLRRLGLQIGTAASVAELDLPTSNSEA